MDKKYLQLISYLATPKSERKIKSTREFCVLHDISEEEYQTYKNSSDFPQDLFSETKRWHMINRAFVLNKFYTQLMSRVNIKPSELQAYLKLIEPEGEDSSGSLTNNYQFNFLSDLDEKQKENIKQLLKSRGSTDERLLG